jgi:hypothetical protein
MKVRLYVKKEKIVFNLLIPQRGQTNNPALYSEKLLDENEPTCSLDTAEMHATMPVQFL